MKLNNLDYIKAKTGEAASSLYTQGPIPLLSSSTFPQLLPAGSGFNLLLEVMALFSGTRLFAGYFAPCLQSGVANWQAK
ncbi:MAG: hypothetical protein ACXVMS_03715 [Flavisolibacter sp.]